MQVSRYTLYNPIDKGEIVPGPEERKGFWPKLREVLTIFKGEEKMVQPFDDFVLASTSCFNALYNKRRKLMDNEAYVYDVVVVYAEEKAEPLVRRELVIARSEDEARLRVGKYVEKLWDADYLTVIVKQLGMVTFKPKPQEVKIVP